jgi:hypothetical protein
MSLNLWFSDLNKTIVATIIVKYRLADYGKWKIFSEDLKTCNFMAGLDTECFLIQLIIVLL